MPIRKQILLALEALNRRDFAALEDLFDPETALDMPAGQRVIGFSSMRDTLSTYLLRHEARFANGVVMVDEAGLRGAVDGTLDGRARDGSPDGGRSGWFSLPCVLIFESEDDRFTRLSLYLSTPL
ncbi:MULTISPECIES: nuclear transport factor 2 family protein [Alphaproteobacteria]|nr:MULTISPECIES: nuclear transport factor 2 family protein [Alphaproteobacteria]